MRRRILRWIWPLLTVVAIAALGLGLQRGEFSVVNQWAHTLCTSCVGLGR
jgi:hypothetical protein